MQALFDEHAGLGLSRQQDLAAQIGDWRWDFDGDAGTMTFSKPGFMGFGGKRISTACQVLGSESEVSATWLWSWANTQSALPEGVLRAANALKARGERDGIPELTMRSFNLDAWDGHQLSLIASGTSQCAGYYRGPYPNGSIWVLLTGPELVKPVDRPALRFSTVLPQLISSFEVHDHRLAAQGLARGLGLTFAGDAEATVGGADGELKVTFDEQRRLAGIEGNLR